MAGKFYITTAIDYPSGDPHLGHAYEKVCADILARWHRLKGENVFFLTGTDEHGQKILDKAQEKGVRPKEYVDGMASKFKDLCFKLGVSNDRFIRTTDPDHERAAQALMQKAFDNGDIYKGEYDGLYCTDCEAYYTEKDLRQGNCPVHEKPAKPFKEETYFFRMSKYRDALLKHIEEHPEFIQPESKRNELVNRLNEVRDLSVSRSSFSWGIPVPFDEKHVQFVWFDALTNYLSGVGWPDEKYREYWPADVHLIGKDIVWPHTMIWGSMLMSAGIELPKTVLVHGFINLKGRKLSKASGVKVDPIELTERYGADALRFYLARNIPFGEDGDFSEETLVERANNELADNIGNFIHRVLSYTKVNFGKIPARHALTQEDQEFLKRTNELAFKAAERLDKMELSKALESVVLFSKECNAYFNAQEPWKKISSDRERVETVLNVSCSKVADLAALLWPYVPRASEKVASWLGTNRMLIGADADLAGSQVGDISVLFKKFELPERAEEVLESKGGKPMVSFDEFAKMDLRVALIENAEVVEGKDKLLKLSLDVGELGKRTIVSGIRKAYNPEDLKGRQIVIIANLEPRQIGGIESQGMLLAVGDENDLALLAPDKQRAPGSRVG